MSFLESSFPLTGDVFNLTCEIQSGADKCRPRSDCTLSSCAGSFNFFQRKLTLLPNNKECFKCMRTSSVQLVIELFSYLICH